MAGSECQVCNCVGVFLTNLLNVGPDTLDLFVNF